jgi:hypothetical protein
MNKFIRWLDNLPEWGIFVLGGVGVALMMIGFSMIFWSIGNMVGK